MLFLHGILGTRANWRAIARRLVKRRPQWGAILVDLPEHGDSLGMLPPHTVRAVAEELQELQSTLGLPVGGALGHSFGGKVVLEWLRGREGKPTEAWIVDSSPSAVATNGDATATAGVIRMLESLPRSWACSDAFVQAVIDAGQPEPIARWLAMNLQRTEGGARVFGPDLEVIRLLVEDYARTDCWDVIEALPERCSLDVVVGGRSGAVSAQDRQRLMAIAGRDRRITVHIVEQASHWVHVDAPDALVRLLTSKPGPQP
jgi:pimeloyl-ACP methyl ester carboxylesterase